MQQLHDITFMCGFPPDVGSSSPAAQSLWLKRWRFWLAQSGSWAPLGLLTSKGGACEGRRGGADWINIFHPTGSPYSGILPLLPKEVGLDFLLFNGSGLVTMVKVTLCDN